MDAEKIADEVAQHVRDLIADAQQRAEETVRGAQAEAQRLREEAEAEAERIRAAAEAKARARVDQVRQALEQLEAGLGGKPAPPKPKSAAPPEPGPKQAVEPEPGVPEPKAPPEPQPQSEQAAEFEPDAPPPKAAEAPAPQAAAEAPSQGGEVSTDELIEQLKSGGGSSRPAPEPAAPPSNNSPSGDTGAARLVAMKLALDGTSRDEARERLAADYDVADLDSLLDEVYAKVRK